MKYVLRLLVTLAILVCVPFCGCRLEQYDPCLVEFESCKYGCDAAIFTFWCNSDCSSAYANCRQHARAGR